MWGAAIAPPSWPGLSGRSMQARAATDGLDKPGYDKPGYDGRATSAAIFSPMGYAHGPQSRHASLAVLMPEPEIGMDGRPRPAMTGSGWRLSRPRIAALPVEAALSRFVHRCRVFRLWRHDAAGGCDPLAQRLSVEAGAAEHAVGKNGPIHVLLDEDLAAFERAPHEQQLVRAVADTNPGAGGKPGILDDRLHPSASCRIVADNDAESFLGGGCIVAPRPAEVDGGAGGEVRCSELGGMQSQPRVLCCGHGLRLRVAAPVNMRGPGQQQHLVGLARSFPNGRGRRPE